MRSRKAAHNPPDWPGAQRAFFEALAGPVFGHELFDSVADTVFFVKDRTGRYIVINQTLVERAGLRHKADIVGRTAEEVFPGALGARIGAQDRAVLGGVRTVKGELELHLYANGHEGWCLTWKEPLFDKSGAVAGLLGLSRDVRTGHDAPVQTRALSLALEHAREHLDRAHRLQDLAHVAGMSAFQFDKRIRLLFGLSAGQYLTRLRIESACHQLRRTALPIAQIALASGYADQTAFTRQFRKVVGLSPLQYRKAGGMGSQTHECGLGRDSLRPLHSGQQPSC